MNLVIRLRLSEMEHRHAQELLERDELLAEEKEEFTFLGKCDFVMTSQVRMMK